MYIYDCDGARRCNRIGRSATNGPSTGRPSVGESRPDYSRNLPAGCCGRGTRGEPHCVQWLRDCNGHGGSDGRRNGNDGAPPSAVVAGALHRMSPHSATRSGHSAEPTG